MFLQICHTPDLEFAFLDKKYVSVYSIIGNYLSWKVLEQELFSLRTEKKNLSLLWLYQSQLWTLRQLEFLTIFSFMNSLL